MCSTVCELSLNLLHSRCQKLDRRPKTITRPELTNRAEKKHVLRQIETTSRLMDDWWSELWWKEDDKRLRKKVRAPQCTEWSSKHISSLDNGVQMDGKTSRCQCVFRQCMYLFVCMYVGEKRCQCLGCMCPHGAIITWLLEFGFSVNFHGLQNANEMEIYV